MTPELFEKLYNTSPRLRQPVIWYELINADAFCTMVSSSQSAIEDIGGPNSERLDIKSRTCDIGRLLFFDLQDTGASLKNFDGIWYKTIENSTPETVDISSRCKNKMNRLRKCFEKFAGYFREQGSTLATWNELHLHAHDEYNDDYAEEYDSELEVDEEYFRGSPGYA